jgi:MFS family permease
MTRRRVGLLLALSYVGFVSLGLPDGLLGVAWPSIRKQFGLELDALGQLLVAITVGYVAASFSSGRLLARMNLGALLAASCAATATSLLGYAFAPAWFVLVGFCLFAGLGAGAIDAALNTYVATNHSARTLNWLHACYGIGAASGPALMTAVLMQNDPWQRGYWIVAAGQIALALCFFATRARWPSVGSDARATTGAPARAASSRATLAQPAAWLGMVSFFTASTPGDASWYAERLIELGCEVDVWETIYLHGMQDADAIVEWVKGNGAATRAVAARCGCDCGVPGDLRRAGARRLPERAPRRMVSVPPTLLRRKMPQRVKMPPNAPDESAVASKETAHIPPRPG